ncbi:MAG: twin-arginine translocation signal domain-containing protein [Pirellulaceae bacterium]
MSVTTSRRDFLRSTAAAGGWLVVQQATSAAPARPLNESSPGARLGQNSLVTVVMQSTSRDINPRAGSWLYITEVLRRAGVFFQERSPDSLISLASTSRPIVLLAGELRLTAEQRQALAECVKNGGALIGIGGTSGLDDVFGVHGTRPVAEGWLKATGADHHVMAGLRSSLHVFGGCVVTTTTGTSLAELESGAQGARGSAIVENLYGTGRALLLAPDLLFSIVHIQQGLPVLQDGKPAPDGSAVTNEGVLKAEDGLVLDWVRDRQAMQPDNTPVFLEPVSDELREIILRSVLHVAQQQGVVVPLLWYWPRGLKAVGHLSHDTDGNDPHLAAALLDAVNRCNVKSTWCTLYPGGYPSEFYHQLQDQNFEIALHYDAMSGGRETSWSKENFLLQHRWLLQEAGLTHIASNKNHYTRWENRLDFWRWCEEAGINSDQTRGPSKKGTIGFPLGGSQPYFPLDDETATPRILNVLEINMLTQDLVVVCPPEYGRQLMDSAVRHHGVAHFLFHPAHILKPMVFDALSALVDYGRTLGLEWWTNEQIYRWETLRRGVAASCESGHVLTLRAAQPLAEVTLLVPRSGPTPLAISVDGRAVTSSPWSVYGFEFDAVPLDLTGQVSVQIV